MKALSYTRYELLRTFRNGRFLVFSVGFPLLLFFVIAVPNRHEQDFGGSGVSIPLYLMVGLATFGTMMAMISSGGRIAFERTVGWTRQLRITPLSTAAYFRAKVLTAYAMALLLIALLYAAGASIGVSLPAGRWVEMTCLILIGLMPFAALGVVLGHLMSVDSIGPLTGGIASLLALLSGTWFPLGDSGFMHDVAQFLPSYWLVQTSQVGVSGDAWQTMGWVVVLAWTAVLVVLARVAYRRDTARV